jgi:hypothetical protein
VKKHSIILTGGLACAACCAPLIWPFVVGAGFGGAGLGAFLGRNLGEILCISGILAAATGLFLWLRLRNKPAACSLENAPLHLGGVTPGPDPDREPIR